MLLCISRTHGKNPDIHLVIAELEDSALEKDLLSHWTGEAPTQRDQCRALIIQLVLLSFAARSIDPAVITNEVERASAMDTV